MKKTTPADPFYQHRQSLKGVFVATTPKGRRILAKAFDYKDLWQKIREKELDEEKISIKYLEPKGAICAY